MLAKLTDALIFAAAVCFFAAVATVVIAANAVIGFDRDVEDYS